MIKKTEIEKVDDENIESWKRSARNMINYNIEMSILESMKISLIWKFVDGEGKVIIIRINKINPLINSNLQILIRINNKNDWPNIISS